MTTTSSRPADRHGNPLPTPGSAVELRRIARNTPAPQYDFGLPYDPRNLPVAFYPGDGDGFDVTVTAARMPALFYEVHCPGRGVHMGTGSGGDELAHAIAVALAGGTLAATEPLSLAE